MCATPCARRWREPRRRGRSPEFGTESELVLRGKEREREGVEGKRERGGKEREEEKREGSRSRPTTTLLLRENKNESVFSFLTTDLAYQVACCRVLHKVGATAVVARLLEAEPGGVPRRGQGGGHACVCFCLSTRRRTSKDCRVPISRLLEPCLRECGALTTKGNRDGVCCVGSSVGSRDRECPHSPTRTGVRSSFFSCRCVVERDSKNE